VEARALKTNIIVVIEKFMYECILNKFGCPLIIATNKGVHFINDAIKYLINQFLLKHVSSTTYYPQGNGQAKFTNKVFGTLLTKLVNDNRIDLDEHLFTMLFSYRIAYKVATRYTPYQVVHGLHPLMPTKHIIPIVGGDEKNSTLVKVLTSRIIELEKLQEIIVQAVETARTQQWDRVL
jgi:hypothetical protein